MGEALRAVGGEAGGFPPALDGVEQRADARPGRDPECHYVVAAEREIGRRPVVSEGEELGQPIPAD